LFLAPVEKESDKKEYTDDYAANYATGDRSDVRR
jgi:hypothetical protein